MLLKNRKLSQICGDLYHRAMHIGRYEFEIIFMNTMSATDKELPQNWVRRESTTRRNQFYYFNTKTKQSQWQTPVKSEVKKPESKNIVTRKMIEKNVQGSFKISSKSKIGKSFSI